MGYYGTQYRVRLWPPFGYSILYEEYYLTEFNHQKKATQLGFDCSGVKLLQWVRMEGCIPQVSAFALILDVESAAVFRLICSIGLSYVPLEKSSLAELPRKGPIFRSQVQ